MAANLMEALKQAKDFSTSHSSAFLRGLAGAAC